MAWTATVTRKYRDTSNFNIVAEIEFTDGTTTITDRTWSVELSDAYIAEHVRKRITNVLEVGDAALDALTVGPVTPAQPPDTTQQDAINAAQAQLRIELDKAAIAEKAAFNPKLQASYDAVLAAQAAIAAP